MRKRSVDRAKFKDYLKRAEECANAMKRSYESTEWNACVINAVHSMISAADALCIFKLGLRHAGQRHEDAVALLTSVDPSDAAVKKNATRLSAMLGIKTDAEYGERLMSRKDADSAVKSAERFLSFVKDKTRV